ncbi:unnamed protein product [Cyclocybe aegerita]|uniref:Uncharacterized protein n=1 Tax=Cyclocybe aegerita TaxID=1973307 RepID=A0A8S0VSH5_CYCAE|nr:unnamed protein product [Cyclocybe aegerita]
MNHAEPEIPHAKYTTSTSREASVHHSQTLQQIHRTINTTSTTDDEGSNGPAYSIAANVRGAATPIASVSYPGGALIRGRGPGAYAVTTLTGTSSSCSLVSDSKPTVSNGNKTTEYFATKDQHN